MKKANRIIGISTGLILASALFSCTNNGREVDTQDAENVVETRNENTLVFAKVKDGSFMEWRASHIGGAEPRWGKVYMKSGEVLVNEGKVTNLNAILDMTSFTVDNFEDEESKTKLTGHLQSDDFFKVETYPTSTFELTKIEANEGEFNSKITGNLKILDVTKSITFSGNVNVSENEVSITSENFAVDRTNWGLKYNVEGTEGVPTDYIIANEIGFTINVVMTK